MLVLIVISEGVGMMLFNQVGDGGGTVWYHTIPSIDAIWAKAPFHRFINCLAWLVHMNSHIQNIHRCISNTHRLAVSRQGLRDTQ